MAADWHPKHALQILQISKLERYEVRMPPAGDVGRDDTDSRRLNLVMEHVNHENAHDLSGVLSTFGTSPSYHDEPWADNRLGMDAVTGYYEDLLAALPDLNIEIHESHVAGKAIVLEVTISGTHQGTWRGLPGTGRPVRFPLCGVFTFDEKDRIRSERIYYDRASVLRQLGVFREPTTIAGRLTIALNHPVTVVRAYARRLRK
jgi:steroid delta-isomerase-like uncharacterized protein